MEITIDGNRILQRFKLRRGEEVVAIAMNESDARLFAAAPKMLAMLRRLEWSDCCATVLYCPICEGEHPHGAAAGKHAPDCELAALLALDGGTQ